jgi:hypothetical protein
VAYYGIVGQFATYTNATATNLFSQNIFGNSASITNFTWGNATGNSATVTNFVTKNFLATGSISIFSPEDAVNNFGSGFNLENNFGIGQDVVNNFGTNLSGNINNFNASINNFNGESNFSNVTFDGFVNLKGQIEIGTSPFSSGPINIGNAVTALNMNTKDIFIGNNNTNNFTQTLTLGTSTIATKIFGNSNSIISMGRSVFTNATSTTMFAEILRSINGSIDNLVTVNFEATNATLTNATSTNFAVSNLLTALNAKIDNLLLVTDIIGTNATFTNGTSTNWFVTNLTSPNISGSFATITNATFTSIRSDVFYTSNFGFDNVFAQNATFSAKLSVGGPFVSNNYKVNFVDNVPGIATGSAAFSMTNLATNTSISNSVLRLNTGAPSTSTCDTTLSSGPSAGLSSNCARFITFYASSTNETDGVGVGRISLNSGTGGSKLGYFTNSADFGEYLTLYEGVEYGDIISQNEYGNVKAGKNNKITGVVSNNTGFVGNLSEEQNLHAKTVGYLGLIETKVSTENGPIKRGDPIGIGSVPGIGVKMLKAGYILGHARESYSGEIIGRIEVQVAPTWYDPNVLLSGESLSTTTVTEMILGKLSASTENQNSQISSSISNALNNLNNIIDSRAVQIVENSLATGKVDFSTSSVNRVLDRLFIDYFTATSTIENLSVNGISLSDIVKTDFVGLSSEGTLQEFKFVEMQRYVLENISKFNKIVDKFNENVLTVAEVVTDKLTAKEIKTEKLCIGDTCVSEAELKEILQAKVTPNVPTPIIVNNPITTTTATTTSTVEELPITSDTATTSLGAEDLPNVDNPSTIVETAVN